MKKVFPLACLFLAVFTFAAAQAIAGGQQKGAQTGQSSQFDRQDEKAGAAGPATMSRSGQMDAGAQQGSSQVSRISELMDKKVQDEQGRQLGQIEDLVVTKDGRISYIILSQGGVMGIGDKLTPIPFKNAQFNPQQDAVILSGIDKQKLENAPTITQGDWQMLSDPSFEKEVFSYYGQPGQMSQPGASGMGRQSPTQQRPGQSAR